MCKDVNNNNNTNWTFWEQKTSRFESLSTIDHVPQRPEWRDGWLSVFPHSKPCRTLNVYNGIRSWIIAYIHCDQWELRAPFNVCCLLPSRRYLIKPRCTRDLSSEGVACSADRRAFLDLLIRNLVISIPNWSWITVGEKEIAKSWQSLLFFSIHKISVIQPRRAANIPLEP